MVKSDVQGKKKIATQILHASISVYFPTWPPLPPPPPPPGAQR